ncbi:MAG: hypothetical protein R8G66_27430 [Cytophagales bacterium]|nr:hypothetical protein [Cytophagales bacterium]
MTPTEVDFITKTIETEEKSFGYQKDQYAFDLLSLYTENGKDVNAIRNSRFGHLLEKPMVKEVMASRGSKKLNELFCNQQWKQQKQFNYTIDTWGKYTKHRNDDWYQTSRSGINLVLQLNFDFEHNTKYFQYLNPNKDYHPFVWNCHPVKKGGGFTMAWARLDVDLDTGEALIEEIQTDWLREARDDAEEARNIIRKDKHKQNWLKNKSWRSMLTYYEEHLMEYIKLWDEAVLDASLMFLIKELGCRSIYYHTFETGCQLKGLGQAYSRPPRSLYTRLPKKFGFRETDEAPTLLKKEKLLKKRLRDRSLRWYEMNL